MTENSHSLVGASSAERFMNCPGSVREIAKCPPQPESEYAKEGSVAHWLAEMCLKLNKKPFDFLGYGKDDPLITTVVNEDMAEAVQVYLDVIDADLEKYHLTRKDLQVEKKFHLKDIHKDAYGTCDAVLPVFLTKCIVYDFKYGSGVAVDAEDNKQGQYYALGAAAGGDYEEFEVVIVQPRAIHKLGPVRRWTVSRAELDDFANELSNAIRATKSEDAPLHCGEWCKKTFCPAIVCCPAVRHDMQQSAMVVFNEPLEKENVLPKPEELTPLMLRRLLDNIPLIDTFIKAVEDYALQLANKGVKIPDYKLVARRSNRKWINEQEVKVKFGKTAVKTVEIVLSPSQLETELKTLMPIKEAKKEVEQFTYKPDTGNVLVPWDDPREEVKPKLEQTFEDSSKDLLQ